MIKPMEQTKEYEQLYGINAVAQPLTIKQLERLIDIEAAERELYEDGIERGNSNPRYARNKAFLRFCTMQKNGGLNKKHYPVDDPAYTVTQAELRYFGKSSHNV